MTLHLMKYWCFITLIWHDLTWSTCVCLFICWQSKAYWALGAILCRLGLRVFIYRELKQFLFKMLCQKCIWSTLLDPFNQYQKLCISWQVRVWINKVFSRFLNKPMVFHSIHWIYWFYANMKQNIEQGS